MIKCHFVDVKSISSELPRSSFDEAELELLADAILAANGLLRPLILERTGAEKYKVIEGDREYYAAVRAKEKDIKQAEMVNAFVIEPQSRSVAIDQINLLTTSQQNNESSSLNIDTLVTAISSIVAQQLQQILTRLDRQEVILSQLDRDRSIVPAPEPVIVEPISPPPPATTSEERSPEPKPSKTRSTKTKTTAAKSTEAKPAQTQFPAGDTSTELHVHRASRTAEPTPTKTKTPQNRFPAGDASRTAEPKATKTKSPAPKQIKASEIVPVTQSEPAQLTTNPLASVDPIKAIKTLDLIDRLDEDMLMRRMKQSGIPKAEKLVPNMIAKRNAQPNGKFDSWEQVAAAKISGLGEATILKIIDKLK